MGCICVTDLIGEDYKNWRWPDWILLSFPTGLGKTHFILYTLLRHAASRNKHLVYYCNRKFLNLQFDASVKTQLLEGLGDEGEALERYLHVRTYQNAEKTKSYPNVYNSRNRRDLGYGDFEVKDWDVLYYIFDEAQYPVVDCQVNPGTHFWVKLRSISSDLRKIHVFLTATPEPFRLYYSCLQGNLSVELMQTFLLRYYLGRNNFSGGNTEYWLRVASRRYQYLASQYDQAEANVLKYMNDHFTSPTPSSWEQYQYSLIQRNQIEGLLYQERDAIIQASLDPYRILYDFVETAYQLGPKLDYHLDTTPTELYSYVDERYFDDLIEMAGRIAASAAKGERWLIFVRKKDEGELLATVLRSYRCSAVTITARTAKNYDGRKIPRRSPRSRVMDALVWRQELGCNVLISTSVLDNGISLHADAVDHLVLCQPGKTSFLQMLGRVRVREGQRLRVYIQRQKPKEIKGYIDQCKKDILFLIRWELNRPQKDPAPFSSKIIQPIIHETEKLEQERQEHAYRTKYLVKDRDDVTKNIVEKANPLVLCNLLGNLYDMEIRACSHGETDGNYYLRHQLSWLGKEYDPTRWIDYEETTDELTAYLEELAQSGKRLYKEEQLAFRRDCLRLLNDLCGPSAYLDKVRGRFSLEQEDYPGMKVLNLVFEDARIPYRIRSRQPGKTKHGSRESYWIIEKRNEAKESEHPLQDAPKLTD